MTNTNFNFKGFNFPKTDAEKVRANVEAVALVKELEKTQQQATADQQEVLAKYVGTQASLRKSARAWKTS